MAKKSTDLKAIVDAFVAEIEEAVTQRVNEEFANRFDELRAEILGGTTRASTTTRRPATRRTKPAKRTVRKAEMRPCPISGIMNSARRYSYLMPEYRTKENLEKYRGWTHRVSAGEEAPPTPAGRGGRRTTRAKAAAKTTRKAARRADTPEASEGSVQSE